MLPDTVRARERDSIGRNARTYNESARRCIRSQKTRLGAWIYVGLFAPLQTPARTNLRSSMILR
jgi:hypothetical protein